MSSLDGWLMSLSTDCGILLTSRCMLPKQTVMLRGSIFLYEPKICDLGLNYSVPLNFSECVSVQLAKSGRNLSLIFRKMKLPNSTPFLYKVRSTTPSVWLFDVQQCLKVGQDFQ